MWENYVIAQAQLRGAWVFKACSDVGPADIILWNGLSVAKFQNIVLSDVKAKTQRNKHQGSDKYNQIHITRVAPNVAMIQVDPSDKTISWHPARVPAGWEDFWSSEQPEIWEQYASIKKLSTDNETIN